MQMVPKRTKSAFVAAAAAAAAGQSVTPRVGERVRFLWSQKLRAWFGSIAIASVSQLPIASLDNPWLEFAESRKVQPLASISTFHLVTTALDLAFRPSHQPSQWLLRSEVHSLASSHRQICGPHHRSAIAASKTTLLLASAHPPICVQTLIAASRSVHHSIANMSGRSKVSVQPINIIFRHLQQQTRVSLWLYDNVDFRIEGKIIVSTVEVALCRDTQADC
jgi:hypothetical protein